MLKTIQAFFSIFLLSILSFGLSTGLSIFSGRQRYSQYHCRLSTHDALGDIAELKFIIAVISTTDGPLRVGIETLLAGVILDQSVYLLLTHVACRATIELKTEARRESICHPLRGMALGPASCGGLQLGAGADLC